MFKNYSYDSKRECHSFDISDIDIADINGIRRTILTDIPIVGIIGEDDSTVDIDTNGPLHNEFLTHRIGLIPLNFTDEKTESYIDNELEFQLNVKNETINTINVTTEHITSPTLSKKELETIFPKNNITKHNILITRLRPDEYINFKATAVKKMARYNASFSCVSLCNFSYIEDPELADKETNVLNKERAFFKNKYGDATKIKFELEIINNLSVKYVFNKAIEIIINKLINLRNKLSKNEIKIEKTNNTYYFYIDNEDDTLGNIIQSNIHNLYIREKQALDENCKYIGYICPHPLKELLVIGITLETDNISTYVKFLDNNCKIIIQKLEKINANWNKFISKI